MHKIKDIFERAYSIKNDRGWDFIYVAVDLHGTICDGLYTNDQNISFYPEAIKTLKLLSFRRDIKLILFTSTHPKDTMRYLIELEKEEVRFNYINENPECPSTTLADFTKKIYFNVLLDDKAGFDPVTDWSEIYDWLLIYGFFNGHS